MRDDFSSSGDLSDSFHEISLLPIVLKLRQNAEDLENQAINRQDCEIPATERRSVAQFFVIFCRVDPSVKDDLCFCICSAFVKIRPCVANVRIPA